MIPKLIHYSWFSGEPYLQFLQECMGTWKKVLPDYEFMLWDAEKLAACNNTFSNLRVFKKNTLSTLRMMFFLSRRAMI